MAQKSTSKDPREARRHAIGRYHKILNALSRGEGVSSDDIVEARKAAFDLSPLTTPTGSRPNTLANPSDPPAVTVDHSFAGFDPKHLYSTSAVAARTGMTVSFFEAARLRGGGPPYIVCGKRSVRYLGQDVITWLVAGQRQNTSQGGDNV